MDSADERFLQDFWMKFDRKVMDILEKECWKVLPKLDKLNKEILGLRRRDPEDFLDRYNRFMDFVHSVYLIPSLSNSQKHDIFDGDCCDDNIVWDTDEDEDSAD